MKHNVTFIHASPAAIPPLMQFYPKAAPDLEITNLLDDGLLRLFSTGNFAAAEDRLAGMLAIGSGPYEAELALLTCSALPRPSLESLRACAGIPVIKIDEALARRAVETGTKIGVVVTFPPTADMTRGLVLDAAEALGRRVEFKVELLPDANSALLAGDTATHDRILLEGVGRLHAQKVEVIVLAQVSMARVLDRARAAVPIPVLSSLETSLEAIRATLHAH
jgi:Asp/Glu/hydantoin racemase